MVSVDVGHYVFFLSAAFGDDVIDMEVELNNSWKQNNARFIKFFHKVIFEFSA